MRRTLYTLLPALLLAQSLHAQWTPFCSGSFNGTIVQLENFNDTTYALGFFSTICGQSAKYLAKFNGSTWEQVGAGLPNEGHVMHEYSDTLYLGTYEFGTDSNWVYQLTGNEFVKIGSGVFRQQPNPNNSQTASIYGLTHFQNQLIACGEFTHVGGLPVNGIMRWNGTTWDSLGSGLSGNISGTPQVIYPHSMVLFENRLIVAGNFKKAGGQIVNGIAAWDGTSWSGLGEGFNSTVYSVGVYQGVLYAGGDFTSTPSGNTNYNRIARWDGNQWIHPGFGFLHSAPFGYTFIHTIKEINQTLYIAGGFDRVQDSLGNQHLGSGIVAYDGNQIDLMGGGIPLKDIEGVTAYNNTILAGGGVFGNGYLGIWNPISRTWENRTSQHALRVYPNPVNDKIHLEYSMSTETGYFQIRNLLGQIAQTGILESPPNYLDVSQLNPGTYFIQLVGSDNFSYNATFIKE